MGVTQGGATPTAARPVRQLTVFVPAYNEERNLEGAVRDVIQAAEAQLDDYEILIVDDGSTDGTGNLADRLAREDPRIKVIHHPGNRGFAAGYQTALARATLRYFTFVPGDGEMGAGSIGKIFGAVGSTDIVVPYRENAWDRPLYRTVISESFTRVMNLLFNLRLRYYQGPAVYPTELARALPTTTRGFCFATEMLVRAIKSGYCYVQVGFHHQERAHGKSKAVSVRNVLATLKTMAVLWWDIYVRRKRVTL